jgi:Na+/H+ antiporter NhaD/arsenite permease-like protein
METTTVLALCIFIITYLGIVFTRLPGVNVDRPSAAFSGAVAMVALGVLTPAEAIAAVDMNTILLLLGMMIVIATLQLDGFFTLLARQTIRFSRTRRRLLVLITLVTGLASAFLVNDAVVLMFTPVILQLCLSIRLNPVPYLVAEILASNAGSALTITGNPQNMLIGIQSGMSYAGFMGHMLPIALIGLLVVIVTLRILYRKEFAVKTPLEFPAQEPVSAKKMARSGTVFLLIVLGFFLGKTTGFSIPLVAITGAALTLLLGEVKPSEVIQKVDWVLLLFFAALFVVVRGIEKTGLLSSLLQHPWLQDNWSGIGFLHGSALIGSQIVSNVPFVVLLLPLLKTQSSTLLWLSLASASTLSGNATLIGAMANLIVVESAARGGVKIGFGEFLKSGLTVTLITLPLSAGLLWIEHALGWMSH